MDGIEEVGDEGSDFFLAESKDIEFLLGALVAMCMSF